MPQKSLIILLLRQKGATLVNILISFLTLIRCALFAVLYMLSLSHCQWLHHRDEILETGCLWKLEMYIQSLTLLQSSASRSLFLALPLATVSENYFQWWMCFLFKERGPALFYYFWWQGLTRLCSPGFPKSCDPLSQPHMENSPWGSGLGCADLTASSKPSLKRQ